MNINKIYNEDCRDTMARMSDNFLDLTVTSPPYDNLRTYNNDIDKTWNDSVWKQIIKELYRVTKEGGVVVWVVGDATINGSETGTSFRQALYAMECGFNLHDTMIYETSKPPLTHKRYEQNFEYMFIFLKGNISTFNAIREAKKNLERKVRVKKWRREKDGSHDLGKISTRVDKIKSNVWYIESGVKDDKISYNHVAVFPEKLARDHIYSWSNEGDLVYDPFMGSGTTAKMAHLLKRNWIGSEISKEYVDLAYKRIDPYLKQTSLF